jgi:alpha-methylacyl-CoA racemase
MPKDRRFDEPDSRPVSDADDHPLPMVTQRPILHGFRVVSLAQNVPGPVACAKLVELGAGVLKIEPLSGDPLATFAPEWYRTLISGQEVIRHDLRAPAGIEYLDRQLDRADLLLTSMRPAALERAGLDWSRLSDRWPHLSLLAIVGHSGPHGDRAGHDLTYQAEAGLLNPPVLPSTLLVDLAGADQAVSGALQLLWQRERGDPPRMLEVVLAEIAIQLAEPLSRGLTSRGAMLGGGYPLYGLFETAAGWIAVAALEPHFRRRMLEELSCEATYDALREAFLRRTAHEWESWAAERDLPIAAVRSTEPGGDT